MTEPHQASADSDLHQILRRAWRASAAAGASGIWELQFENGDEPLSIELRNGQLILRDGPGPAPDVRFWLVDRAAARDILTGQRGFMETFIAGQLRSDGHLIMSLQLLVQYFGASHADIDPDQD